MRRQGCVGSTLGRQGGAAVLLALQQGDWAAGALSPRPQSHRTNTCTPPTFQQRVEQLSPRHHVPGDGDHKDAAAVTGHVGGGHVEEAHKEAAEEQECGGAAPSSEASGWVHSPQQHHSARQASGNSRTDVGAALLSRAVLTRSLPLRWRRRASWQRHRWRRPAPRPCGDHAGFFPRLGGIGASVSIVSMSSRAPHRCRAWQGDN